MATHASTAAPPEDRPGLPFADADGSDPGRTILPDTVLLEQVKGGSQGAFAWLYDRHIHTVYRACLRVNSDQSAAAEVVQDTFLTLWDRAELFDPARGSLAAWLATIARNRAVDHLRKSGRQPAMTFSSFGRPDTDDASTVEWLARTGSMLGAAGPERTPDEALADEEASATIARALASITPSEREVIVLAYHAGLSQSEIAARLDWPLGTVKTRTRRALQRLREHLEAAPASRPLSASRGAHAGGEPLPEVASERAAERESGRREPSLCGGA